MENHSKSCGTDCREDLLCKMIRKVDKTGVWKFITISITAVIFLWGVAYTIHAGGNTVTETVQKEQGTQIAKNTTAIVTITVQLTNLKDGQDRIESDIKSILLKLDGKHKAER